MQSTSYLALVPSEPSRGEGSPTLLLMRLTHAFRSSKWHRVLHTSDNCVSAEYLLCTQQYDLNSSSICQIRECMHTSSGQKHQNFYTANHVTHKTMVDGMAFGISIPTAWYLWYLRVLVTNYLGMRPLRWPA